MFIFCRTASHFSDSIVMYICARQRKEDKMKRMRRIVAVLAMLVCLSASASSAMAADDRLGTVVGGSLLTDGVQAEGYASPIARGAFLSGGSGSLFIVAGRTLQMNGTTTCYRNVDTIKVKLYLQRLVGDNWYTIEMYGPATKSNSAYVSTSTTCSVGGGYYYRVYGAHTAIDNGVADTCISYSNGVWVY